MVANGVDSWRELEISRSAAAEDASGGVILAVTVILP